MLRRSFADPAGHKIGTLQAVYVKTITDEPTMVSVQVGLPARRRLVFVPLDGASVGPGYVKVAYDKALVKQSPPIGTDDVLPAEDEAAVFAHFGIAYQVGAAYLAPRWRRSGRPPCADPLSSCPAPPGTQIWRRAVRHGCPAGTRRPQ